MKILVLTTIFSIVLMNTAFASASVELEVQQEGGELQVINNQTKTGFIQRGGKDYWNVIYAAEPGSYTIIGKNPECPAVTQGTSFEDGKRYSLTFTKDCKVKNSHF